MTYFFLIFQTWIIVSDINHAKTEEFVQIMAAAVSSVNVWQDSVVSIVIIYKLVQSHATTVSRSDQKIALILRSFSFTTKIW